MVICLTPEEQLSAEWTRQQWKTRSAPFSWHCATLPNLSSKMLTDRSTGQPTLINVSRHLHQQLSKQPTNLDRTLISAKTKWRTGRGRFCWEAAACYAVLEGTYFLLYFRTKKSESVWALVDSALSTKCGRHCPILDNLRLRSAFSVLKRDFDRPVMSANFGG